MSTIDSQVEAVIAEDAAARNAAVQTLLGQGYTFHGGQLWKPPIGEKANFSLMDDLRQQLADVSAERDRFSRMYDSAVGALCAIGEALGVDEDDQSTDASIEAVDWLKISINDLKLRLNASEARNAKARELLSFVVDSGGFSYATVAKDIRAFLAQSVPATKPSTTSNLPDGSLTDEGTKSPATDEQGADVVRETLQPENQRVTPARVKCCMACGEHHEGMDGLPCPNMTPYSRVMS
ncbi:hypothetical protein [Pseudomonas folii]|uniref:Uncharacterized protein n=1 Tax=Pseudomonas folii TaxID=2762593 RepID=A0ABR7ATR2_9PSED|nr:hypothetical protein [Pseudomonas folii]MBC3948308.1 hypothetical protein [Pseudomonas folii]